MTQSSATQIPYLVRVCALCLYRSSRASFQTEISKLAKTNRKCTAFWEGFNIYQAETLRNN